MRVGETTTSVIIGRGGQEIGFILLEQDGVYIESGDDLLSLSGRTDPHSEVIFSQQTTAVRNTYTLQSEGQAGDNASIVITDTSAGIRGGYGEDADGAYIQFEVGGWQGVYDDGGTLTLRANGNAEWVGRIQDTPDIGMPIDINLVMPGDNVTLTWVDNHGDIGLRIDGCDYDRSRGRTPIGNVTVIGAGAYNGG